MRVLARESIDNIGKKICVSGWVNSRRDHGGVIFIDLRDHTGIVQLVFNPDKDNFELAESLRDEFVIRASGIVRERGAGLENPNIATGKIEILVDELEILNKSETPVVTTHDVDDLSNEELRLRYRYLDLRRPSMQQMIAKRSEYYAILRQYMSERDFIEISTPILANSSPEGARDFLIPSRIHGGKFYALPQAPQQYKQLLMVGGVPRYYQIAACFRDEDPRADRLYGEFYQLDMEMAFVEDGETIRQLVEPMIKDLVTDFASKKLLFDDIPRIPYHEAIETYGSDKPDLRYGMKLIDLSDIFNGTEFKVFQSPCVKAIRVERASDLSRSQIDHFTEIAKSEGAGGLAYIKFIDGGDEGEPVDGTNLRAVSPIAKFITNELPEIVKRTGAVAGDTIFFGADERAKVNKVLGRLRIEFADHYELKNPDEVALCWVTDFPFYEYDEKAKRVEFGHNPFSMPKGGLDALQNLESDEDKLSLVAEQFDMVMNGYEICSGAVRNHNPEIMYKVFGMIGYSKKYVEEKFGALLEAFKFGAPPHAGCAFGLDRIFMVLAGTENIRDVVAFPKNGSGVDVMMQSPSKADNTQLKELGIELIEE